MNDRNDRNVNNESHENEKIAITPFGGIHHVTAITSSAEKIYDFYTTIMGLRLVKKTVNQDDIHTYHLFFADDRGNAGTDITFFDFQGIPRHQRGTDDISRTGFRVPSDEAIAYWQKRLSHYGVKQEAVEELFGSKVLRFEDFDGQRYALFSDENDRGVAAGEPWHKGPVPDEYAIWGLGPIFFSVADPGMMDVALTRILQMRKVRAEGSFTLYEMGEGGNGASVIVEQAAGQKVARQGYGGVHHVAFRVKDRAELELWRALFDRVGLPNSGFVDRFYFKSVYIRLYPGILFELATDGPGFIDEDESYEILGETLDLPPHLKDRREYIEKTIRHFDTVRSTRTFPKEYF